jgi:hypothetical protein
MNGCTNPNAVNYNPAATVDDGTCLYLENLGLTCVAFEDVAAADVKDESFTLSYSIKGKDWVFFHDYFQDMYFSTRDQLYSIKDRKIFKHNSGAPGVYYGAVKPFFVDVVFNNGVDATLNSLNWLSEVFNTAGELEFSTLTHITVWNGQQCSGRITIDEVFKAENLSFEHTRKTKSLWSFNTFKDLIITRGTPFLENIFNNFAVIGSAMSTELPWYEQKLFEGDYFIVRFEFDNVSGNQVVLHGVDVDITKSYR